MWQRTVATASAVVCTLPCTDHAKSFFVGDAAGRTADFADTDKGFAHNVGIGFRTPEEEFG
jgi:hypothetical protein